MEHHHTSHQIQVRACITLRALAENAYNQGEKMLLLKCGRHVMGPVLLFFLLNTRGGICNRSIARSSCSGKITAAGGIEVVLAAMERVGKDFSLPPYPLLQVSIRACILARALLYTLGR